MHCLDSNASNILYTKYPFLMNYFKQGIFSKKRSLSHCLLFWGSDLETQYYLALEIARMLNCKNEASTKCQCLNCNWIRENKHPAVKTISRLDNKPTNDTSKTVISVEQARMIKNDLSITSDYHRVLIFCDKDDDDNILGLNIKNFQEEASNALLKTFEEPPENTTFIFLTKDKSDVIDTIISRAQSFYLPSMLQDDSEYLLVNEVLDCYWELEKDEYFDFIEKIGSIVRNNEPMIVFCQIQNYILKLLKENLNNNIFRLKLIRDIKSIEKAKQEYLLNINIQTIIENLGFSLMEI